MEPYKADLREIHKGVAERCPVCKNDYRQKDDKLKIVSYGACCKCLLEKQLGHPYITPSYVCSCGKEYTNKKNLERHLALKNHLPQGAIPNVQAKID